MTRTLRLIAATLALAAAVAACGSARTATSTQRQTPAAATTATAATAATSAATTASTGRPLSGHATVAIRNFMFAPMHLMVRAGTRVSFHNFDQTAHTATAINRSFDSGTIQPGRTATVRFTKPGTYAYHCLFHAFMTATITVVAARG